VRDAGSEAFTTATPDRFWAEYGNGTPVGVQAGSPILSLFRMRSERKFWSNIAKRLTTASLATSPYQFISKAIDECAG
jgi:hypothetical protein